MRETLNNTARKIVGRHTSTNGFGSLLDEIVYFAWLEIVAIREINIA